MTEPFLHFFLSIANLDFLYKRRLPRRGRGVPNKYERLLVTNSYPGRFSAVICIASLAVFILHILLLQLDGKAQMVAVAHAAQGLRTSLTTFHREQLLTY